MVGAIEVDGCSIRHGTTGTEKVMPNTLSIQRSMNRTKPIYVRIFHACGHSEKHLWPDLKWCVDLVCVVGGMRAWREVWEETTCKKPCSKCVQK